MKKCSVPLPFPSMQNQSPEKGPMNTAICLFEKAAAAHRRLARLPAALLLLAAALLVPGCTSSSSSRPQVGAIAFTDAFGNDEQALAAITAGRGAYMDVAITNDSALLGATWSVTCKSALPPGTPLPPGEIVDTSCGTFAPLHTLSAPIPTYATSATGYVTFYTAPPSVPKGGTVTLFAASTSDPSQYSSVTLTID